jgi:glutaredoxin 3
MSSAASIVKNNRFVMLSKSWCPDCHYAMAVFNKHKVLSKIHLVELDKMEPSQALKLEKEFTALSGRKWVPSLFFNGKFWGNEADLYRLESLEKTQETFKDQGLL